MHTSTCKTIRRVLNHNYINLGLKHYSCTFTIKHRHHFYHMKNYCYLQFFSENIFVAPTDVATAAAAPSSVAPPSRKSRHCSSNDGSPSRADTAASCLTNRMDHVMKCIFGDFYAHKLL